MLIERPLTTPRRVIRCVALGLFSVALALAVALLVGQTRIDVGRLLRFDPADLEYQKVWGYRLPRAVAALIVGGALGVGGVVFQALIRNPLASPYVLGVSTGGSLGAVLAVTAGVAWTGPAAFAGAVGAVVLVWTVARSEGRVAPVTLLLAGVIVNAFFSAAIMFVNLMAAPTDQNRILRWLIGGLHDQYGWDALAQAGGTVVLATGLLFVMSRQLNLLSISESTGERAGLDVPRVRTVLFLLGSLLTAVAVSISGPIAFVGLIVPHVLRLLAGPDHRVLVPLAALVGGSFLVLVDVLGQTVYRTPLPAGVITAFVGGPLFLYLLRRRDRARAGLHG